MGTKVQLTKFSVPFIKYSFLPMQSFCMTFGGIFGLADEELTKRLTIILCQIGAAPVIPDAKV